MKCVEVYKELYHQEPFDVAFCPYRMGTIIEVEDIETLGDVITNYDRIVAGIIVASMYYCGPDFPAVRQAIKETLYATGIDLIVLDEGLDTRTASRREVEDYFEAKRCEMHAEIMFAWRKKQGAGFRLTNSVPFGYIRRNGESNMIKDEEVAPYLSEAFSRYASGQKMRDIAKWLNEQGVDPPMKHKKRILGKPYDAEPDQWTTDMLRCLFRNPTYTGATANGSRQIIAEADKDGVILVHVITFSGDGRARGRIAHFDGATGFLIHPVQIGLGIRNFRLNLKNVCTDSICQIFGNFCGDTAGRKIGDKSFAHDNALPLDNFV